jgi:hypothetical protein
MKAHTRAFTPGRVFSSLVFVTVFAAVGWGLSGRSVAQVPEYDTSITIAEIMDSIVMPEADVIWGAVSFTSGANGFESVGPESDDDWIALRRASVALAESANTLVIPGRHANVPDVPDIEGELSPKEIDALISTNRSAWIAFTKTLRSAATQATDAIDSRDLDRILDVGGDIDSACESCHLTFWYPDQ